MGWRAHIRLEVSLSVSIGAGSLNVNIRYPTFDKLVTFCETHRVVIERNWGKSRGN